MIEVWKPIKGYEGLYDVSSLGRVRSHLKGKTRFLNPSIQKSSKKAGTKYSMVSLSINKKPKTRRVHRLVAETFIENPLGLPDVNHKNGIGWDNRVDNLEWVTKKENMQHSSAIGTIAFNIKISFETVKEMRRLHKEGLGAVEISKLLGFSRRHTLDIIKYKTRISR